MAEEATTQKDLAKKKLKRFEKLKSDRKTTETLWSDIAFYTLPSREILMQKPVPGRKNTQRPLDTTATWANEQLAAGIHGMMTSAAIKWFTLKVNDPSYDEEDGLLWLGQVERIMYNVFNSPRSLFNQQAHEMYLELCAFGTGVFYQEMDEKEKYVHFRSYPLVKCFIDEDEMGKVNTLYRDATMTAEQAMTRFKDKASKKIKEAYDRDPYCDVSIVHAVEPRPDGKKGAYKEKKPFSSCYICVESQEIMEEGGYDTFPYQVPRFSKRTNEKYGFGPGGAALSDARMVNQIKEVTIRGAEKMVDPPLLVPDDGMIEPITLQPGGLNYYQQGAGEMKPLITNARPEFGERFMDRIQEDIIRHFYVDWLSMPQQPNMTATEVLQRRDERLRLLSPMLSRMQAEFLGPLIDRVFMLLAASNMIPDAPESLMATSVRVEYTSPLAQAQRFAEMDSIMRSLNVGMQLSQIDPMVMQNYKLDDIVRFSSIEVNNMPAKLMSSKQEVNSIREEAGRQQAEMQDAQLAVEQTKAAKQAANAEKFMSQAQ